VVAIDGRSGAGKSTVARILAEALEAACIPCDDFFAADVSAAGWDARTPAERAADALDWRRLRREVLEPLRAGRVARWAAFDFVAGARSDGSYGMRTIQTEQAPRPVVLLDGAYSSRPELADLLDCTILVEAPAPVRRARLAAREQPDFLAAWDARWGAAEEYYFTRIRPPADFEIVLRPDAVE
jgi:para-aminobenzoate synthetase